MIPKIDARSSLRWNEDYQKASKDGCDRNRTGRQNSIESTKRSVDLNIIITRLIKSVNGINRMLTTIKAIL